MRLQILIPQYNETEEIIKPLLDSIAIQQNVDFEKDIGVIIVNDGSDIHLSNEFLSKYPFKIEYYLNEHLGLPGTREICFNYATADYVMFCDADDMFHTATAVYAIFNEIEKGEFDHLISDFIEESRMPNDFKIPAYVIRERNCPHVHGKVYRRQFLIDNNIHWNASLKCHEDSNYNFLCKHVAKELRQLTTPFYLWRWREKSICRGDDLYMQKTYIYLIDSMEDLIYQFLNRKMKKEAVFYTIRAVHDTYFALNKQAWLDPQNIEYRNITEQRFKKFWSKYKILYQSGSLDTKQQILKGVRIRMYEEGMLFESITFEDWIKHIESL